MFYITSWLVTTITICFVGWVYARWQRVKGYWAERGVPHLPPHPLFGSLTFLQRINVATWMRQMYSQFDSPYVGIWLFWRPALLINSPALARQVLVKDAACFRNRFASSSSHDQIGSLNLFTTNDPLWSNVRRRLTPMFTSSKMKAIQILMKQKSEELVQRIANENKTGDKFNIREIFTDYTTDVVGTATLGVKSDAALTGEGPIREITRDFQHFNYLRGLAWSTIFFFPDVVRFFRFRFFPKATTDYFRKVIDMIVKQRKAEPSDDEPRDLLDVLLKMKDEFLNEPEEYRNDLIVSQATVLLQGGFETSSSFLAFATYELAHNPEIQDKVYKELTEAKQRSGNDDFDDQLLSQLPYFNSVIKETLRLYSPMGWLDRVATQEYAIDAKLSVAAGTPVYVNATGMHCDPRYFPEPRRFLPDRFLPENEANIEKFTYLPFGEGPRICIGQRFAQANIRSGLAAVVLNYELKTFPNTPKPSEIQLNKKTLLMVPDEELFIQFIPRK